MNPVPRTTPRVVSRSVGSRSPLLLGAVLALAAAFVASGAAAGMVASAFGGAGSVGSTDVVSESATGGSAGVAVDSKSGAPVVAAPSTPVPIVSTGGTTAGDRVDVVRTGSFALEVSGLDESLARLTDAVKAAGGYVASSSRVRDAANPSLVVTYRVPAAAFDGVLAAVRSEGTVLSEQIDSYEVTMQLVDLEARLKNLRASESALSTLMARAKSVADVLAVQAQLTQVRGDIESLDAQRAALADQVAMTTLSVQLTLPASPVADASKGFSLIRELRAALGNLISVARSLAVVLINVVVVVLPVALAGALVGGAAARMWGPIRDRVRRLAGDRRRRLTGQAARARR